jgi:hypothetical protein
VNVPGADVPASNPPRWDGSGADGPGADGPGADGPGAGRSCPHGHGDHAGALTRELRALALVALDRLDPLLVRLRDAVVDAPAPGAGGECAVCATLAAVRAERPELAGRLAAHATGLAAALREALTDRGPSGDTTEASAPARRVQHIPVDRVPAEQGRAAGRDRSRPAPVQGTPC